MTSRGRHPAPELSAVRRYTMMIQLIASGALQVEKVQLMCVPNCCHIGDIELTSDMTAERLHEAVEARHRTLCGKRCHGRGDFLCLMFDLPKVKRWLV